MCIYIYIYVNTYRVYGYIYIYIQQYMGYSWVYMDLYGFICAMIKTRNERLQLGSAINFQSMWFPVCSDRGPCVAIPLFKTLFVIELSHCSLFWSKRLMSLMVVMMVMMMMMMVMVMLMMLIQMVTMLRYVEKASLCGRGLLLQNHCP